MYPTPHPHRSSCAGKSLMCLLLAACAATAAPESAPSEEREASTPEVVDRVMQPWTGDFDDMAKRRFLRILVSYGTTSYLLDRGQQKGITYEAFKEFEGFINRRQATGKLRIQVVFIPVRRDQLLPHLIAGKGDIAAANLTITDSRQAQVDFADPVLTGVSEVVVTGPDAPPVKTLDDLAGREIVVRRTSSYYESLQKLNTSLNAAGKAIVPITLANEDLEDEDLLEMVNAGLLPMTVVDSHIAQFWSQILEGITVHETLTVRTGGRIAWAVRKDSPRLQRVLNEFVRDHRKGTAFGNILFNKYLRSLKQVRNSAAPDDLRRFNTMAALFQKYARQYDFDWLLVAAQAYQESRLDQSLRSPAGAVGVMQILPRTAAGPPINIRNIDQLESNIHAGVAYLCHLRDQYFDDPSIDPFNQQLLAFAAYNAGPARVAGLRQKAKALDLDPNKWFRNVEIVAAREIGRETVDYVANILKYYVAYDRVAHRLNRQSSPGSSPLTGEHR